MSFLYFLEDLRCPFLDTVMQIITYCGEELVFMALAIICYWCVSKAEGYYILFVGFLGTVINQCLKLFFRIPRPWVRDPNFKAVESALDGASGYSFPSGHTQSVTGTFGAIAIWNKKLWLRVACVAIIVLTAFSRMYLGVHTPADVGVSLGVALVLLFVLYPLVRKAAEEPKVMYILLGIMTAISLAYVIYANYGSFPADMDLENLEHGRKNSYTIFGCLVGFILGYTVEHRFIRFDVRAPWWGQLIKIVGGLAGLLIIKEGLKPLFSLIGYTHLSSNAVRYGLMVIFATCSWPLLFGVWRKKAEG